MKKSGPSGLTALAVIAVAGLVFSNTDFGSDLTASSEQTTQPVTEEESTQVDSNFAEGIRNFIGGPGAGESKGISGIVDSLDIGNDGSPSVNAAEDNEVQLPDGGSSGSLSSFLKGLTENSPGTDNRSDRSSAEYTAVDIPSARQKLSGLEIKGRAPKTGYDRDQFGPAWTDNVDVAGGHNGCDTRSDILGAQLDDVVFKADTNGCKPLSGSLNDPYTGNTIPFSSENGNAIHIDHVVALSDAWQKGAQQWDAQTRVELANDPDNLIAVDGPTNMAKGDGDAATWQPPNKAFRCEYAAMQINVKAKYGLWVTQAEHDALSTNLGRC